MLKDFFSPEILLDPYKAEYFIADYFVNNLTDEELLSIKTHFRRKGLFGKSYNKKAINLFIGKYFAVIVSPNKPADYMFRFAELKEIDDTLYQILENFSEAWHKYDYNSNDPNESNYHFLLFDFIDELEEWTKRKRIW